MALRPEGRVGLPEVPEPVADLVEDGAEEVALALAHVGHRHVERDPRRRQGTDEKDDRSDPPPPGEGGEDRGYQRETENLADLRPRGGRFLELEPGKGDEHGGGRDQDRRPSQLRSLPESAADPGAMRDRRRGGPRRRRCQRDRGGPAAPSRRAAAPRSGAARSSSGRRTRRVVPRRVTERCRSRSAEPWREPGGHDAELECLRGGSRSVDEQGGDAVPAVRLGRSEELEREIPVPVERVHGLVARVPGR